MARWGASAFPTGLTPKETAAVRAVLIALPILALVLVISQKETPS